MDDRTKTVPENLARLRQPALIAGAALLAVTLLLGLLTGGRSALQAYLWTWLFWIGIPLGSLGVLLLHQLVAGAWGYCIQRICEAAVRTLPLMALLSLPVLIGAAWLFPWVSPESEAMQDIVGRKTAYLNLPFFVVRAVFYFAVWIGIGGWMVRWSRQLDETGDHAIILKMRRLGAVGLVAYVLTLSFAAFDWGMSLEPEWFSTIYGAYYVVSYGLAVLAFAILVLAVLAKRPPYVRYVTSEYFHHLGNLLLAFVVLWSYIGFSQFLITWSGNLPEEIVWYKHRTGNALTLVSIALMALHFAVPFFLLLVRRLKHSVRALSAVAAWLLVMRVVDFYWVLHPAFVPNALALRLADVTAFLGIGALWFGFFIGRLEAHAGLPANDPRMADAFERLRHEEEALEHA